MLTITFIENNAILSIENNLLLIEAFKHTSLVSDSQI